MSWVGTVELLDQRSEDSLAQGLAKRDQKLLGRQGAVLVLRSSVDEGLFDKSIYKWSELSLAQVGWLYDLSHTLECVLFQVDGVAEVVKSNDL